MWGPVARFILTTNQNLNRLKIDKYFWIPKREENHHETVSGVENLNCNWWTDGGLMWITLRVKNSRGQSQHVLTILWDSALGTSPGSYRKFCREIARTSDSRRKRSHPKTYDGTFVLNKAYPQVIQPKLQVSSEWNWPGEKETTSVHRSHSIPPMGSFEGSWETVMKFTVQRHRLIKKVGPNHSTKELLSTKVPSLLLTTTFTSLFSAVSLTQYIMPNY